MAVANSSSSITAEPLELLELVELLELDPPLLLPLLEKSGPRLCGALPPPLEQAEKNTRDSNSNKSRGVFFWYVEKMDCITLLQVLPD
jgi:hypothetical protein